MKKMILKQNRKGFSMAEMLIVVAILVVLAAVSFIAVQNHQKSMTQLEYDTIAKEIFIAAQNHLTMADSQGYSDLIKPDATINNDLFGTVAESSVDPAGNKTKPDVFYIQVTNGVVSPTTAGEMLQLMLPGEAIDPTIYSGDFIIRYQRSAAVVLDVFYSNPNTTGAALTVRGKALSGNYAYKELMENYRGDDKAGDRRSVPLGWFGDENAKALPAGEKLNDPVIEVYNEEKLWVLVKDTNANTTGKECSTVLKVTGETSTAEIVFWLADENPNNAHARAGRIDATNDTNGEYKVVLDDITTANMHFASMNDPTSVPKADPAFFPGENIAVEAISFSNTKLTNIAYSGKKVTNSLFANVLPREENGTVYQTAMITNFRHLENLSPDISDFDYARCLPPVGTTPIKLTHAEQTTNLIWQGDTGSTPKDFISRIHNDMPLPPDSNAKIKVYLKDEAGGEGDDEGDDLYVPVNIDIDDFSLVYEGNSCKISNVKADATTYTNNNAGLFGQLQNRNTEAGKISNLELIDFNISGANAGGLIGSAQNYEILNVLVHNKTPEDSTRNFRITGSTTAGGLIGSMDLGGVEFSAAAVIVDGGASATAGGLIGSVTGTDSTINGCYSGGHTKDGSYQLWIDGDSANGLLPHQYDVTGATAGGLVGSSSATITNSYSTCSVNGTTTAAGGFVGSAGGSISNCYCTGLVTGGERVPRYAFAGSGTPTISGCWYYEIINEDLDADPIYMLPYNGYSLLNPDDQAGIKAIDHIIAYYDDFVGAQSSWTNAEPYDAKLTIYYHDKSNTAQAEYNLRSIARLGSSADPAVTIPANYYVNIHYGDWPAPEIFIINN